MFKPNSPHILYACKFKLDICFNYIIPMFSLSKYQYIPINVCSHLLNFLACFSSFSHNVKKIIDMNIYVIVRFAKFVLLGCSANYEGTCHLLGTKLRFYRPTNLQQKFMTY
jgi:hypothetical protein